MEPVPYTVVSVNRQNSEACAFITTYLQQGGTGNE